MAISPVVPVLFGLLASAPALAQDDDLGDILGTGTTEPAEESGPPEEDEPSTSLPLEDQRNRRVIKTLQRKTFMKLGRYEASPHIGFVTNDPFINRYLIGSAFAYHITEVFAIDAMGSFSPDFGTGDYKAVTQQLIAENRVSPDISKINYYGSVSFQFSPIYGKVAVTGGRIINFDIFGVFGTGAVHTTDDLEALQCVGDPLCEATKSQFHATTNLGGGIRVIFDENFAFRLEGRSLQYIETIASTTLEMKNNFTLLASASVFFPGMEQ